MKGVGKDDEKESNIVVQYFIGLLIVYALTEDLHQNFTIIPVMDASD